MIDYALGILQFGLLWAIGFCFWRWIPAAWPIGYRLAVAFGLAQTLASYLLLGLGLLGALQAWLILPPFVLAGFLGLPMLLAVSQQCLPTLTAQVRWQPVTSMAIAMLGAWFALGAAVPEREVDALWYHLAVPQFYWLSGGLIQEVPYNLPSHYPMNGQLHYVISLMLGNEITAKVFQLLHVIPLALLLGAVVKRYLSVTWSLPAVLILLCAIHWKLPVMANVQRMEYFYALLAFALLWHGLESGQKRTLIWAGLFTGMAMGVKLTAILLVWAPGAGLFAVRMLLQPKRVRWLLPMLVLYSLLAWALLCPWLLKTWLYTGNPFYPALPNWFPAQGAYAAAAEQYANTHGFTPLKASGLVEWFRLVGENLYWWLANSDLIPLLAIVSLLLLPAWMRKRWLHAWLSALFAMMAFTLLWGHAVARLFSITYGVLCLLVVIFLAALSQRAKTAAAVARLVPFLMLFTFVNGQVFYLASPNIDWFFRPALTEPARQAWLIEREVVSADLFAMRDWIEPRLPSHERIYAYQAGYPFYLRHSVIVSDALFGEQIHRWLQRGRSLEGFFDRLQVRYLLAGNKQRGRLDPECAEAWQGYRQENFELIHQAGDLRLYRRMKPLP